MRRPTPVIIFTTTALGIALILWMASAISPVSGQNLNPTRSLPPLATVQPDSAEVLFLTPTPTPAAFQTAFAKPAGRPTPGQNPGPVSVQPTFIAPTLPPYINDIQMFTDGVANGQAGILRGIFSPDLLAMPVIQQPDHNNNWISDQYDNVTQFRAATEHGVVGLLAHNTRAGRSFNDLQPGKIIYLVYGDRTTQAFKITDQHGFQALQPLSPSTDFIDLANGQNLTTGDVFNRFFTGSYPLVLLTCLEKNGDSSWGRLFLVAVPAS